MEEQEYRVQVTLLIKAETPEDALDEFEKRVGKSDYTGEEVDIQAV